MPVGKSLFGSLRMLPWDSSFWGFRVAGWAAADLTPARLHRGLAWCRRNRVRCLYLCADGEDATSQRLLQQEGFLFVDVRTEMEKKPLQPAESGGGILLRKAQPRELPALLRLASSAHGNTRFAKDPGFPGGRSAVCIPCGWPKRHGKEPCRCRQVGPRRRAATLFVRWRAGGKEGWA